GGGYRLKMPEIAFVKFSGSLPLWVSAKDVILELLRRLTVTGGKGKIFEYGGSIESLSVYERATITNMGTELGATTSIFPSDETTKTFLEMQGRGASWKPLVADREARYDHVIDIDLSLLEPLVAKPHSPDNVITVQEAEGIKIHQVAVGSCTNSSFKDLMTVAAILKGRTIHEEVSLVISPGSRQVLSMIAENGALADLVNSGARILESSCGPCIGMGQTPPSGGRTLRTFNRNFRGRSGATDAEIYLCSPEVAAVSAIEGVITDPRRYGCEIQIEYPKTIPLNDNLIIPPPKFSKDIEILRGPHIAPAPLKERLPDVLVAEVLLKVGNNITTDHILPGGAKILPLRSNVPALSQFVFQSIDPLFSERAKKIGSSVIVGGENYGQGSSREHAALAPMYLGVKAVIAQSFARIHRSNLINCGIIPLMFKDKKDYDRIAVGESIEIDNLKSQVLRSNCISARVGGKSDSIRFVLDLSAFERKLIICGGLLNYTQEQMFSS
ncbi:MAG: aconitate hydratase, partial [Thermodesulfobacteriota bacterium]|nr:aconitate hydratase [Thermodesulfobacteriota bacterium]